LVKSLIIVCTQGSRNPIKYGRVFHVFIITKSALLV
jgi:hypothetical protein